MTDDLISRQAAIDALGDMPMSWADTDAEIQAQEDWKQHREALLNLPTAEKKGEWIPVVDGNYIVWECSECHVESDAWTDFCPICGSRNIEEMDEEAFEKALEEFRKNPKTYTLDEVEAELGLTADPNDGGERMSKWIPTAERLPDKDGTFLVTEQAACNVTARWVKIASYAQNLQKIDPLDFKGKRHAGWFDYDSEYGHYELSDIIAWMPLEEPYKEDSDGEI